MAKKKVAMVAPVPSRATGAETSGPPPIIKKPREIINPPGRPKLSHDLATVLLQLGNDRPYVLVATAVDHWIVHFNGVDKPSGIMLVDGKWKIVHHK